MDSKPMVSIGAGSRRVDLFAQIRDARKLPSGEIVIVDGASNELRFFTAGGTFLRKVGGTGSGPAEFRRISGVVLDHDTLRVFDSNLQKIVSFDGQGRFARSQPIAGTGSGLHPLRLYRLAGFMNQEPLFVAYAYPANMRPAPARIWDSVPTLRYTTQGKVRDTIGEFLGMDSYATPTRTGSLRFGRVSSAVVHDNRLYVTDGAEVSIRVYDASGARSNVVKVARPPRPVTAADVDRLPKALRDWPHAATKPWVSQIRLDDLGLIWVEQYVPIGDSSPSVWDVLSPSGGLIGTLTMPPRLRLLQIGRDFVVGVALDDDDVEVVRVYRLTRT